MSNLSKIQKNHREFSSDLINLSFLLYRLSSTGYELLRRYLPLPSHSKIYEHINKYLPSIITNLKEYQIAKIPHPTIKASLNSPNPIPIVVGIDAVCVVASSKYNNMPIKNLYAFTIYIQPIMFGLKCLPIRIIESQSGIGNKEIVKLLLETCDELTKNNFDVKFISFDGDPCYNPLHQTVFNLYEKYLFFGNLMQIIYLLKKIKKLPIGDYFHIMKNQRSRFLKVTISLDGSGKITFKGAVKFKKF